MKKILSLILIIVMTLALCACEVKIPASQSLADNEQKNEKSFDKDIESLESSEIAKADAQSLDANYIAPAANASNNLYGYVDLQGNWVVDAKYSATMPFTAEWGMILDDYSEYIVVDRNGNNVFSIYEKKTISSVSHLSEDCLIVALDNDQVQKYIYLAKNLATMFNVTILPKVAKRSYSSNGYFGLATPFVNGKSIAMRIKNSDLKKASDADETAHIINKSGEILASFPSGVDPDEFGFDDNMRVIAKNRNNQYGLFDDAGKAIVECSYVRMLHCDGDLYLVCNSNGMWGYIDKNGNSVIDCQYQKAMPFSEGLAAVYDGTHWGFVNEEGKYAIASMFDSVVASKAPYIDASLNAAFSNGVAVVEYQGSWVMINKQCKALCAFKADTLKDPSVSPFGTPYNGYIAYSVYDGDETLYGLLTVDGKQVLEPQFRDLGIFN